MMAATPGFSKIWKVEETYRLIESFQSHPALWKKENKEHRNKSFRGVILEHLAVEFNTNAEAVKEKLRSLRTVYGQNLKKLIKNDITPKWEFFDALSFLKPEMLGEPGQNDEASEYSPYTNDDSNNFVSEEAYVDETTVQSEELEPVIYHKKLRTQSPELIVPTQSREKDTSPKLAQPNVQQQDLTPDRNRSFGDYVALSLDLLNDALVEEKVKLEIQLLLSRAITETATSALRRLSSSNTESHHHPECADPSSDVEFEQKWHPDDYHDMNNHDDAQM